MDFKRSLTDLGAAERAARGSPGSIGAQRGKKNQFTGRQDPDHAKPLKKPVAESILKLTGGEHRAERTGITRCPLMERVGSCVLHQPQDEGM